MSLNDRLAAFFKAHPHEWIDGRELAEVAGHYAWRSRCSDLRTKHGMNIENRQRRCEFASSTLPLCRVDRFFIVSEYCYEPPSEIKPSAPQGHDLNVPWSLR